MARTGAGVVNGVVGAGRPAALVEKVDPAGQGHTEDLFGKLRDPLPVPGGRLSKLGHSPSPPPITLTGSKRCPDPRRNAHRHAARPHQRPRNFDQRPAEAAYNDKPPAADLHRPAAGGSVASGPPLS